jgi:2-polyprenyl-6-methoxyphenol hydroxylase-like FAD-dependent oxidoreductase
MAAQEFSVQCCIAGGGPAGMMAGLLLARAGVEVLVVEKHADFLRDFRGDTIHPSTLEILGDLRLADMLLKLPHQKVRSLAFHAGGETLPIAEFDAASAQFPFVAIMPQWDFLDFLAREAARYVPFNLIMEAEATGIIEENGRIAGARIKTGGGEIVVRADLTIAADETRRLEWEAGRPTARIIYLSCAPVKRTRARLLERPAWRRRPCRRE